MSLPTLSVQVSFDDPSPFIFTTYDEIGDRTISMRIRRGRQDELGRIEAGTAEITIDNRDRRYDPFYTAGPFYGSLTLVRPVRIQATWNSVTYTLWRGFVENYKMNWSLDGQSTVTLQCVDGFTYFAHTTLSLSVGAASSGFQLKGVGQILDSISWPSGDQNVNGGDSSLQAFTMTNGNVLEAMQLIADSENGYLWMGADGKIWYRERHWRINNSSSTNSTGATGSSTSSRGTFSDAAGATNPYSEIEPSYDDSFLYNDIHITRSGGSEQVAQDSTSQNAYFKRSLTKTGLLITTDNEANDAAYWLLSKYKDAALRFKRLTLNPQASDSNLWPHALGRDFHDRITVVRTPPGGGSAISLDCFIEGIEHDFEAGPKTKWLTSWDLSPASSTSYWVLDDAVLSILDSTTRLVY